MLYTRHILLTHASNFRDLGGYPTGDGHVTKWRTLFRSDALSALTGEEWETVKNLGVTLLIDLRSEREREMDVISPPDFIAYSAHSLMRELDQEELDHTRQAAASEGDLFAQMLGSMTLDYTKTLFGNLACAADVLDLILQHLSLGRGSIIFLCSAGKDRTGMIAALLLYLCGVPKEDIIADYMVSNTYNTNGINQKMNAVPEDVLANIPDKTVLNKCFASDPETITVLLNAFEERNIRQCLQEQGFGGKKQRELAECLLDSNKEI